MLRHTCDMLRNVLREHPISKHAKFDRTSVNCKSRHELLPRTTKTSHQISADAPAAHEISSNYFRITENAQPKIFCASSQILLQHNNATPCHLQILDWSAPAWSEGLQNSIEKTIRSNSNEIAPLHPSHRISCAQTNNHTHTRSCNKCIEHDFLHCERHFKTERISRSHFWAT